ncbi:MAG: hypothetical protein AAGA37_20965 [Actinomycetota bacterium]
MLDITAGKQVVLQFAGWTGGGPEAQMESVSAVFAAMFNETLLFNTVRCGNDDQDARRELRHRPVEILVE